MNKRKSRLIIQALNHLTKGEMMNVEFVQVSKSEIAIVKISDDFIQRGRAIVIDLRKNSFKEI